MPASNPRSRRLASYSQKSVTLVCEDAPKTAASPRIPDSVDPRDAHTRVLQKKIKNHSHCKHARFQIQIELDAKGSRRSWCKRKIRAVPQPCSSRSGPVARLPLLSRLRNERGDMTPTPNRQGLGSLATRIESRPCLDAPVVSCKGALSPPIVGPGLGDCLCMCASPGIAPHPLHATCTLPSAKVASRPPPKCSRRRSGGCE